MNRDSQLQQKVDWLGTKIYDHVVSDASKARAKTTDQGFKELGADALQNIVVRKSLKRSVRTDLSPFMHSCSAKSPDVYTYQLLPDRQLFH